LYPEYEKIFNWWAIDKKNKLSPALTDYIIERIITSPKVTWDLLDSDDDWNNYMTIEEVQNELIYRIDSMLSNTKNKKKFYKLILDNSERPERVNDLYMANGRYKSVGLNQESYTIRKLNLLDLFD